MDQHNFDNFVTYARGGGGVTLPYGLYGDVPLDRVWFFTPQNSIKGSFASRTDTIRTNSFQVFLNVYFKMTQ